MAMTLLRIACGITDQTPRDDVRLNTIESVSVDDLFPPDVLFSATGAGCGLLFVRGGGIVRGKGVTW